MNYWKNKEAEIIKEIIKTKPRFLKIMRPHFDTDEKDSIEITGEDLLFYGDCCKNQAYSELLEECLAQRDKELEELKKKLRYNVVEKESFISFSKTAFDRDIGDEIDKIKEAESK